MIAVICLDLVLQTAETVDAMARAATFFFLSRCGRLVALRGRVVRSHPAGGGLEEVRVQLHGVVDFLAVLPLWAFTGFDLKALRAFRLFRLFVSTAKLATRTNAVIKLARAGRGAGGVGGELGQQVMQTLHTVI